MANEGMYILVVYSSPIHPAHPNRSWPLALTLPDSQALLFPRSLSALGSALWPALCPAVIWGMSMKPPCRGRVLVNKITVISVGDRSDLNYRHSFHVEELRALGSSGPQCLPP